MRGGRWLAGLGVAGLVLALTLPTLWLVVSSFKNRVDLLSSPPTLVFRPTLSHYETAFLRRGFAADLGNSLTVAVGSSLLAIVLAYPAAVSLVHLGGPLARHLLFFILTTRLVPPIALGLPLHLLYRDWGLLDTVPGLILAHTAFNLSFAVWMTAAYLRRLPQGVFEAARLDGVRAGGLVRLLAPSLAAPLFTVWLFCLVFSWNEFFLGSVLAFDRARTLPVATLGLVTSQGTYWGQFCAVATATVAPVVLFALTLRRTAGALFSFGGVGVEGER